MLQKISIGWILSGDIHIPGSRIHGINIHKQIMRHGIQSEIIRMPNGYAETLTEQESHDLFEKITRAEINTVIFQKVNGTHAHNLCEWLRNKRIRIVFISCDTVDNLMAERADIVFAVSTYLKKLFQKKYHEKIRILNDPVEFPEAFRFKDIIMPKTKRLKGVYLASQYPDKPTLAMLGLCQEFVDVTVISKPKPQVIQGDSNPDKSKKFLSLIKEHRLSLFRRIYNKVLYSYESRKALAGFSLEKEASFEFAKWELETVYNIINQHNVGLIPIHIDSTFKKSKSANRMATFMALGLPVIASPLPAYLEHTKHGKNILLAKNGNDWRKQLKKIDQDRDLALELATNGRDLAWRKFSLDSVIEAFLRHVTGP